MFVKYSASFKFIVVRAALDGKPLAEINAANGSEVSSDSLRRWCVLYEKTRSVVVDPETYKKRGRPLALSEEERLFLLELVTDNPTIYLQEIQQALSTECNLQISVQTILNELHGRLQMSQKTMRKVNPNQDRTQRAKYLLLMANFEPECLVFTDESGVCLDAVIRTRGWAQVGERTSRLPVARATHRFNLIPAVALSGLVAVMIQSETVKRIDFETYLEHVLLPNMNPYPGPQSIIVMDNAQIHHNGNIERIVEDHGCLLIYLPAYSPDLNPIEKGFSVLKSSLRQYGELDGGETNGEAIEAFARLVFTDELMRGLFQGSGYTD